MGRTKRAYETDMGGSPTGCAPATTTCVLERTARAGG